MLAVKYYLETNVAMYHHYVIYDVNGESLFPTIKCEYETEWSKDLTLDELKKVTGNDQISGIIDPNVSKFYIQQFEYRMMNHLDWFRFVDEEFKKGKSIEQIKAEWDKQKKINAITESAKEYK